MSGGQCRLLEPRSRCNTRHVLPFVLLASCAQYFVRDHLLQGGCDPARALPRTPVCLLAGAGAPGGTGALTVLAHFPTRRVATTPRG